MGEEKKVKAKYLILSDMLSFPMIRAKDWKSDFASDYKLKVGDLVSLSSASASKWYVSWVREIEFNDGGFYRYLLESIEDGSLCWWSNVVLNIYNRERVQDNWQWEDKQFAFNDRWLRVCNKIDGYNVRPRRAVFNKDGSITLDVYVAFNYECKFNNPKSFPNWKQTTMKMMRKYFIECQQKYKSYKEIPNE